MLLLSNWWPFSPLGRRTCPYPRRCQCPAHCGSEARNVLRPWHFLHEFWCFGLARPPKHIAVAMVSAKCCLSYGECAKMCLWRPQATKCLKYAGSHCCFDKIWWKKHIEVEAPHCTFSSRARRKLTGFDTYGFLYSSIWLNLVKFWHFLHKLWRLKQMVLIMADISAIGPKGLMDFLEPHEFIHIYALADLALCCN